ncbi:hypothetical protein ES703_42992 [subsurface metagenome]
MRIYKKNNLYLDTSIPNFMLAKESPAEQFITKALFDEIEMGKHKGFISRVVIDEISRASEPKRTKLLSLVKDFEVLDVTPNCEILAREYIRNGTIPQKYEADALHIAIATIHNMDILVSWNFAHIVRVKTRKDVNAINALLGYKSIELASPQEVIESD